MPDWQNDCITLIKMIVLDWSSQLYSQCRMFTGQNQRMIKSKVFNYEMPLKECNIVALSSLEVLSYYIHCCSSETFHSVQKQLQWTIQQPLLLCEAMSSVICTVVSSTICTVLSSIICTVLSSIICTDLSSIICTLKSNILCAFMTSILCKVIINIIYRVM